MRYIILAIAILICTAADAQVIRAEPFYTAPEAGVTNLLLDNYPGAAVAYSLRKLDKDYTGSAIRVRRSSDNTEQDIGFLASGFLDTTALKTFVGANNGLVVTWYNQADSAGVFGIRNATQATASLQPTIVSSGALIYQNNIVSVDFIADRLISLNFTPFNAASYGFLILLRKFDTSPTSTSPQSTLYTTSIPPSSRAALFGGQSASDKSVAGGRRLDANNFAFVASTNNLSTTNYELQSAYFNWANSDLTQYINGTTSGSTTSFQTDGTTTATNSSVVLGSNGEATAEFDGKMCEAIIYAIDPSSFIGGIHTAINSFYSIY